MVLLAIAVQLVMLVLLIWFVFRLRRWHWDLQSQLTSLRQEVEARNKSAIRKITTAINDSTRQALNATSLEALDFSFPVMLGGFSIDAHHARALVELLQEIKPRRVIELGSGSSTLVIAKTLHLLGAPAERHVAVDHDAHYLGMTRELCRLNGLEGVVQFELCPLEKSPEASLPWYSRLPNILGDSKFDLLVVDGPPAYTGDGERIREPALDRLINFLSDSAVVLLDDANRPGESAIASAWCARYQDFQYHRISHGKGVAVLRRKPDQAS